VAANDDRPDFNAQLRQLVDSPREDLAIEIKDWLDLSDRVVQGDLARELIGLANHGGGFLLFGFSDAAGGWTPSGVCPYDRGLYSQDRINGIVERHADPQFHCDVHSVTSITGDEHVVIRVPGDHRVPIRAKRAPEGSRLSNEVYYVRRPGPQTAPASSAQEWDDLLRRCLVAQRAELVESFRSVVRALGPEGARETLRELGADQVDALAEWEQQGRDRLTALVAERLPDEEPGRYFHGTWSVAYTLRAPAVHPSLAEFNELLMQVAGHETGWPPWWYPTRDGIRPYPYEGLIECWLAEPGTDETFPDGGHSDLWRGDPSGRMFLIRGYQEDGSERFDPGTVLSFTTPVWRVGECLLHAGRLAQAMDSDLVHFAVRWEGLAGRELRSLSPERFLFGGRIARQDSVVARADVEVARISENLPEIVKAFVQPLYDGFDLFVPPEPMYEQELAEMRRRG
jgi:transcriptional regulator with XRE-family HTH domain